MYCYFRSHTWIQINYLDVKNILINKTRRKFKISMVAWWAFIQILYIIYILWWRGVALPCEYSTYYSEFFTHNLLSLGSELLLNYWRFMPEWFHLVTSSWSPLDLQKFTVKSVGCLGNSGGNASCHGEKCRMFDPVTVWGFCCCWISKCVSTFAWFLNCRKISHKKSDNKIN